MNKDVVVEIEGKKFQFIDEATFDLFLSTFFSQESLGEPPDKIWMKAVDNFELRVAYHPLVVLCSMVSLYADMITLSTCVHLDRGGLWVFTWCADLEDCIVRFCGKRGKRVTYLMRKIGTNIVLSIPFSEVLKSLLKHFLLKALGASELEVKGEVSV